MLQIRLSFDMENLEERQREVFWDLSHPDEAINKEVGWGTFINQQIFPIDVNKLGETKETLPNYGRHLVGGGMVHGKNVEWFEINGYRFPRFYSATLGMVAEVFQEVIEKSPRDLMTN